MPRDLPLAVAVELASAWIQDLARARGLPVLFLKGPGASLQGLRARRVSTDADILVRPRDLPAALAMLEEAGWRRRPDDNHLGIFPEHSMTMLHEHWPCDVDVHFSYPGIEADPEAAFDLLWAERVQLDLAHRPVDVPAPADHAVVLALTALREPWMSHHQHQVESLTERLGEHPERREAFLSRARELRAEGALAPLVLRLDPSRRRESLPEPSAEWRLYTNSAEPATIRLARLLEASWPQKVRMLADALAPSRTALASQDLRVLDMDERGVWGVRARRLARGIASLPSILRHYRHYRRSTARSRGRHE